MQEYFEYVRQGISPKYTPEIGALGLVGEAGEVCDVIKKAAIYGRDEADVCASLEKELGDVIWQWMAMCVLFRFDPRVIIQKNIEKLNTRHEKGGKESGRKSLC